jgi:hypothetical protein
LLGADANSAAFVAASTGMAVVGGARFEAQTGHDLFTPMEVAARPDELRVLYAQEARGQSAMLVPYAASDVVRSMAFLSTRYLDASTGSWALPKPMRLAAHRGQYLIWQLALVDIFDEARQAWSDVANVSVAFSDLVSTPSAGGPDATIAKANLTCFNTEGVDQRGRRYALSPSINTTLGSILPLILGVDIGVDAAGAVYSGSVTVTASVNNKHWSAVQQYVVGVSSTAPPLLDRGDSDPALLSRVRWLNSDFGLDDEQATHYELPPPYQPPKLVGASTIELHAGSAGSARVIKSAQVARDGLLRNISITTPPYAPRPLLARAGVSLAAGDCPISASAEGPRISATGAEVRWSAASGACPDARGSKALRLQVNGSMAFDGYTKYVVSASSPKTAEVALSGAGIKISISLKKTACRYVLRGGGKIKGQVNASGAWGPAQSFDWCWTGLIFSCMVEEFRACSFLKNASVATGC